MTRDAEIEVTETPPSLPSFLSLMKVHDELNELFFLHQEALLMLDVPNAIERLSGFESELRRHMRFEEEVLLPIYERAGRIPGGPVVFFTGEHARMLEFLERFRSTLARLTANYSETRKPADDLSFKREVIDLFDQQAMFKHLVEHHDLRERNILYPTLDRVTDDTEKRRILESIAMHE